MNSQAVEMTHSLSWHAECIIMGGNEGGCEGQEVKQSEANAEEAFAAKTR